MKFLVQKKWWGIFVLPERLSVSEGPMSESLVSLLFLGQYIKAWKTYMGGKY